ncbi:major facilitator superfamily domain-containing protein [Phascolomyces articulosus]|uniref:Major facilitator superfamily domain-containing protein n=1 Tax=Phascolomyces articulosus TaxID=60185 RepID=A0AAD5K826_9FUNG|nr:major facilitator superfamily domain-containing protein [Phascolomyces articulosus]
MIKIKTILILYHLMEDMDGLLFALVFYYNLYLLAFPNLGVSKHYEWSKITDPLDYFNHHHNINLILFYLGVMQEFHEHHEFPNAVIQVTFVGTISNVLLNGLGPVARLLSAITSLRNIMLMAVFLCTLGLELASWSTQLWHYYLTRGVLFGTGASFAFYVGLSIVPQWFSKRQGLALAISSTGTCVGAFSLPFIMDAMNTQFGSAWSYRVQGFIVLVLGLISCTLVRERKKPTKKKSNNNKNGHQQESVQLKEIFQLEVLKDPHFVLWCIADIFMEAAYYVPYFYLPSYAAHLGLSSAQGSSLISIVSGMSFIGNLVSGVTADRIGHINTTIIYCTCCALSCIIWVIANNFHTLILFCILVGFFGGAFIALTPSVTYVITGAKKFESGLSLFLLITVLSMFGPNVSSGLEQSIHARPYLTYEIFTASGYFLGAMVLVIIKMKKTNNLFSKI